MRSFTEDQVIFRDSYRKFLASEIAPHMEEWREAGIVDRNAFKKAGDLGFLMIWPEEKYGGMGDEDFRYEQIIIEETARSGCKAGSTRCTAAWSAPISSVSAPRSSAIASCQMRQRRDHPGDCDDRAGAGSDLAGMRTTAEDKGDHFLLNGSKTYISNGINSDVVIVAAKLASAEKKHAMVLLIVERGMDGFERGRNLKKMGMPAQDTAELFFQNVKVPKGNVLGEPGRGFYYLMEGLAEERLISAVGSIANARKAFDITRAYVMDRKLFGRPLAEQQNTQFRMAEMDAEIDLVQVYVDHCVVEHNAGRLTSNMGAKAKMMSSEVEWKMLDLGVQLHGGAGYMDEYPISRMFTDARVNRILAGSSEVMRLIIGRDVFSEQYKSILD